MIDKLPALFARAKTGKIKQWQVAVEGSLITVTHGQVGGKLQTQETLILEGKNIGKANETTPELQAMLEARSKWQHQYDKDYRENVEDIPTSTLPPLAHKFQERSAALGDEYDVLCKLDGVRCTMFWNDGDVLFQSRGGKPFPVIEEIVSELYESVWKDNPNIVLDGELYCHGMYLEDIVSAVKKTNKDTPKINFYVFDLFDPQQPDLGWEDRYDKYRSLIGRSERVNTIGAYRVTSEKEMLCIHGKYVGNGYEGVICRKYGEPFVFGHRTDSFQKYKIPLDKEFQVIRFDVDKNGCAVPWCTFINTVCPERNEFKAPLVGDREWQQYVATHQDEFALKYLKVVFEKYSKYGVPTKTKGHVFRELDEDGSPIE